MDLQTWAENSHITLSMFSLISGVFLLVQHISKKTTEIQRAHLDSAFITGREKGRNYGGWKPPSAEGANVSSSPST